MGKKNNLTTILIVGGLLCLALGGGGYLYYQNTQLQSENNLLLDENSDLQNQVDDVASNIVELAVYGKKSLTEITDTTDTPYDIDVYRLNVENLDTDDIATTPYSSYSLWKDNYDTGDTFEVDLTKYRYYCNFTGTDYSSYYWVPTPGIVNNVYAVNETEDIAMLAYSTDELSISIANSTYDEWTIELQCLDGAEGTGDTTLSEGYAGFIPEDESFESTLFAGLEDYVVIRIDTNLTTTLSSYFSYQGPGTAVEVCSGQYVYFQLNAFDYTSPLYGKEEVYIKAGSGLGTTFDFDGIAIGHGTADSFTAWDTQS